MVYLHNLFDSLDFYEFHKKYDILISNSFDCHQNMKNFVFEY